MKGAKSPLRVQSTRIFKLFRKFKNTHSVAKRLFRHAGGGLYGRPVPGTFHSRPGGSGGWARAAIQAAPTGLAGMFRASDGPLLQLYHTRRDFCATISQTRSRRLPWDTPFY